MDDGVPGILTHDIEPAHASGISGDLIPSGHVDVAEVTAGARRCKQEVVRQELHSQHLMAHLEAVDLGTLIVVNVAPFLLSHSKIGLVVQPLDITNSLHRIKLKTKNQIYRID